MQIPMGLKKAGIEQALNYVIKDPEKNLPQLMGWADKFAHGEFVSQRNAVRAAINDPENVYHQMIIDLLKNTDAGVLKALFLNFFVNANMIGWDRQEAYRDKYHCNIPWAILLDPTSACNLHCIGCWAAEYGNKLNLTYDEIDDIIEQGKKMGTFMYIYTGGEPLVRKADLIKICEKHDDCIFLSFTNGTLIDEKFADDMLRVHNFVPAISIEGFEEATDSRRGSGTYQKAIAAMKLLRSKRLPFGVSCCYTRENFESITSEEFYDYIIGLGSYFMWYFHYMPIGNDADAKYLLTPEQRTTMYHRIRDYRYRKPMFTMDFQNDGEYVGGCIAGGRRYLHINANGDIDPCVFIHYSDSNIRKDTLLEAMQKPLFKAYHDGQPFNENMLRPCPMLENPQMLRKIVDESGAHSTDLQSPESVEHLCEKCDKYAELWKPASEKLWYGSKGEARYLAKKKYLTEDKKKRKAEQDALIK